jgi:hypothetical protein
MSTVGQMLTSSETSAIITLHYDSKPHAETPYDTAAKKVLTTVSTTCNPPPVIAISWDPLRRT